MKDIYLVSYSVKGIKTLDKLISLQFYKKTISKNPDTQEYNIKGIYGMNGSGKSGIITSVEILRNIIVDPGYLNNPVVQKNLDAMINKRTKELFVEADYMVKAGEEIALFRYNCIFQTYTSRNRFLYCFGVYPVSLRNILIKWEKLS